MSSHAGSSPDTYSDFESTTIQETRNQSVLSRSGEDCRLHVDELAVQASFSLSGKQGSNIVITHHEAHSVVQNLGNVVEHLVSRAIQMEAEKENLLMTLALAKDKFGLEAASSNESVQHLIDTIDTLIRTLSDVDVQISTVRDMLQEEALHKVNNHIDDLISRVEKFQHDAKTLCQSYINLCSANCVEINSDGGLPCIDEFSSQISKCTLDDRKRIRIRLLGLLFYMESQDAHTSEIDDLK